MTRGDTLEAVSCSDKYHRHDSIHHQTEHAVISKELNYSTFLGTMIVRGHEVFSPILRAGELISAAVVMGILAGYEHYINRADASNNGRIIYSLVIACITLLFSILLLTPFHSSFYFFVLDFIFFICWMVAFGLMANVRALN